MFHDIHNPGTPGATPDSDASGTILGSPKQSTSFKLIKPMSNSNTSDNSVIQDIMNQQAAADKVELN